MMIHMTTNTAFRGFARTACFAGIVA